MGSGLGTGESAGNADPRDAGNVARHREYVTKIHLQRIAGFFTGLKSRRRARGAEDHVAFLKAPIEIALDQRANLQARK